MHWVACFKSDGRLLWLGESSMVQTPDEARRYMHPDTASRMLRSILRMSGVPYLQHTVDVVNVP